MRLLILMSFALLLTACVLTRPANGYAATASWSTPELGVNIDSNQKVVVVLRGSSAERAGIQVGDILLEIHRMPVEGESTGETEAIPFTNVEQVKALLRDGARIEERTVDGAMRYKSVAGPFILRLQRDDEMVEMEIEAGVTNDYTAPDPTPTPGDPSLDRL